MTPYGTTSTITRQEAADLLSRLIKESIKVKAVFRGLGGLASGVTGWLQVVSFQQFVVKPDRSPDAPFLVFDPSRADHFRYASGRAISEFPQESGSEFNSVLAAIYKDGTQVLILELEEE